MRPRVPQVARLLDPHDTLEAVDILSIRDPRPVNSQNAAVIPPIPNSDRLSQTQPTSTWKPQLIFAKPGKERR